MSERDVVVAAEAAARGRIEVVGRGSVLSGGRCGTARRRPVFSRGCRARGAAGALALRVGAAALRVFAAARRGVAAFVLRAGAAATAAGEEHAVRDDLGLVA